MFLLVWNWNFAVGRMGKKQVMVPVEKVDISAVKYEQEVIKGINLLSGRFFIYLLFF